MKSAGKLQLSLAPHAAAVAACLARSHCCLACHACVVSILQASCSRLQSRSLRAFGRQQASRSMSAGGCGSGSAAGALLHAPGAAATATRSSINSVSSLGHVNRQERQMLPLHPATHGRLACIVWQCNCTSYTSACVPSAAQSTAVAGSIADHRFCCSNCARTYALLLRQPWHAQQAVSLPGAAAAASEKSIC